MDDTIIVDRLSRLGFHVYSEHEIIKLSVKEVTNPQLFDNLQLPAIGGLYDPALGSSRFDENCATCGQSGSQCPGHMGHIKLVQPVFNPIFFKTLFRLLKGVCLSCQRLYMMRVEGELFVQQMCLIEQGHIVAARELGEYFHSRNAMELTPEELVARAEELMQESPVDAPGSTKLVESEMCELLETMLSKRFVSSGRVCRHCHCSKTTISQQFYSRITVKGTCKKLPSNNQPSKKGKKASFLELPAPEKPDFIEEPETEIRKNIVNMLEKGKGQGLMLPNLAREIMRHVWQKEGRVLKQLLRCLGEIHDLEHPTDMFFLTTLLVPPSRFRPLSVMGDKKFENPQTASFGRILVDNYELKQLILNNKLATVKNTTDIALVETGQNAEEQFYQRWTQLQQHVNYLLDSDLDKLTPEASKLPGIRQDLEKKEGRFRNNMMGKRVNFASRSVISPDFNIDTNQIGVPEIFAKKLTYPQPVTPWNVHELRQYVINGPNNYPGASAVVNEDGSVTKLNPNVLTQREAVAKQLLTPGEGKHQLPKQVLRHLKNGDMMILNRQPTLHKPSMQCHRARVLRGLKTLRLHYSNCKAYNADFDGDEMNAHFPQSELSRAEAYNIASTDFQYLVPKNGAPLAGLIQDHVVAGVALTVRGQFFTRNEYFHLVQSALSGRPGRLSLLPPTILKVQRKGEKRNGPYWSGKQVASTVLLNLLPADKPALCLDGRTSIKEKSWVRHHVERAKPYLTLLQAQRMTEEMGESTVLVDKGELLQGVLDKASIGPSSFGLVHCVYELYGGEVAGQLLTCFGRLFTAFLKMRGFTLGIEDILVQEEAEEMRRWKIREELSSGYGTALEALGTSADECTDAELVHLLKEAQFSADNTRMKQLDMCSKQVSATVSEEISSSIIGKHLSKGFPDNSLQLMVQSGAKGSSINCIQISSMLGQIDLEGRRPPLMLSGRTLPSFLPYDLSFRAGGFVTDRFLTGIKPQEYFFHCMAGREGLIDTAVKTSRSGYLQRCLIKHLEGLMINYDMTVRDSDGSVVQFLYGEDGLEVNKTPFLQEQQLPFLLKNKLVLTGRAEESSEKKRIEKTKMKINEWLRKNEGSVRKVRGSGFLEFCQMREAAEDTQGDSNKRMDVDKEKTGRSARTAQLIAEWRNQHPKKKHKLLKKHLPCPDPVLSTYRPQVHSGVMSERLQASVNLIQQQLLEVGESSDDPMKEAQSVKECRVLTKLVNYKVQRSLCEPGEAVGLLCAQSIGEPSTQMTLNTFHFAGRGEMNVTLGIPRLREILMTASSTILTPTMEIPVLDTPYALEEAQALQTKLNYVCLSDVIESLDISEFIQAFSEDGRDRMRMFRVRFTVLPKAETKPLKPKEIVKAIEKLWITRLMKALKYYKVQKKQKLTDPVQVSKDKESNSALKQNAGDQLEQSVAEDRGETAGDDESDVEANDGDASATKEMSRHRDTQDYEGEEEEKQAVGEDKEESGLEDDSEQGQTRSETPEGEQEESQEEEDGDEMDAKETLEIQKVKSLSSIHDYQRHKKGKWCEFVFKFSVIQHLGDMKSIMENVTRHTVLQAVPGIRRAMLKKRDDGRQSRMFLIIEGVNLMEMMKYDNILDLNSLYTNNIASIKETYGIEAAYTAIIKEVQQVFKPYSIQVNERHLSLLADYMTCEGQYKGFNRGAMNSNPSALQKITFETCMTFLVNACLNNRPDELKSPSARIVAGRVVSCGTGCFDILQPLTVA